MPEVTRFFGIVIRMYFSDHSPAHFHAEYGEYEALVEIETLSILRGDLPRRALALVLEWAALHRQELRADWERARGGTPLESIAPLAWISTEPMPPKICALFELRFQKRFKAGARVLIGFAHIFFADARALNPGRVLYN